MKQLTLFLFFIANLLLAPICAANFMSQNAEGVSIIFLDETDDTGKQTNSLVEDVLLNAISLEGTKYKYGGSSPTTGFDCSGFVNYVYARAANIALPRTAHGISRVGQTINKNDLQPGDLVFFNTTRTAFSHVGIYVGEGNFIHAPSRGGSVRVESMQTSYWEKRFNGAKRLEQVATN
jgi:cell wall-associated NlpC family hydrolase